MAQRGNQHDWENFCCSVCLDLLQEPVTIPCGHNFCMSCIKGHFDAGVKKIYSCPQCRQTFPTKPVLVQNIMLAQLMEELKKTEPQADTADDCYAGLEDVACDVCPGRKLKAEKSCLLCLVSYCEQHLQPHYESPAFKSHKLVSPSKKLKQNICSNHNEVMKIFCCTDQMCICYLCSISEHRDHKTVSIEAERTEKQQELGASLQNIQQNIQTKEEEMKALQLEIQAMIQSADKAVEDSVRSFTELSHLIMEKSSEVKQKIRWRQIYEMTRIKELMGKLEQEIAQLQRKYAEHTQLLCIENHTEFLLGFSVQSLSKSEESSINIRPLRYFEDVTAAVSEARDKLQDILCEEWCKVSLAVESVDVLLPKEEPKTRDEFLKYARQMTLDPDTAHDQLILRDGNKGVQERFSSTYNSHPNRFTHQPQVLSKESLTGCSYWEVEWGGKGVSVSVAYKNNLKMDQSGFGNNSGSWALDCNKKGYKFRHNNVTTQISGPQSSKVGVYLDPGAGTLSFYSVSNTMTLLHRVQTTFTQPLYAGIWVWPGFWRDTTARFIQIV